LGLSAWVACGVPNIEARDRHIKEVHPPFAHLADARELPSMSAEVPILFFDYVDPLSYLLERELSGLLPELAVPPLRHVPLELRPPPGPMLDPEGEGWTERWNASRALAEDRHIRFPDPAVVPWTRKAHELVLHAESQGLGAGAHSALFDAFLLEGRDIGRVDVLVEIARSLGLDQTGAKAVLDVDRYSDEVSSLGESARALGIDAPPAFALGDAILQGFHNRDALRTFLCSR
jgi:predicted DsbA family dithiol-disulfide isomerase